jgi:hypothetical protein
MLSRQLLFSHAQTLFAFSDLGDVSCICAQANTDHSPPTYASCVAGMTGKHTTASYLVEMASY